MAAVLHAVHNDVKFRSLSISSGNRVILKRNGILRILVLNELMSELARKLFLVKITNVGLKKGPVVDNDS